MALNTDLLPTIMDAAGVTDTMNLPGFSLKELYDGNANRDMYYYHYRFDTMDNATIPGFKMLRTMNYKLVRYACGSGVYELFDIANDPKEWNNLACNPGMDSLISALEFLMDSMAIVRSDTFVDPTSTCHIFPNCFTVTSTIVPTSSIDSSDGNITLNIAEGNPPYSFTWSHGDSVQSLQSIAAGAYAVTIDDVGGCIRNFNFNVEAECDLAPTAWSNDLTINTAWLNWTKVAGVNHYKIRGRVLGGSNWVNLNNASATDTTRKVLGLNQGASYEWQIQAACNGTETIVSDWSNIDTFRTGCYAPDSLWTWPITASSARLNWTPVAGIETYEIKGRVAGSSNWVTLQENQGTFKKDVFGLNNNTTYEWGMRTYCDVGQINFSQLTAPIQFTTGSFARTKGVPEISLTPNPNSGHFEMTIPTALLATNTTKVEIYNSSGMKVFSKEYSFSGASVTGTIELNLAHCTPGLHFVHLNSETFSVIQKFLISR